VTVTVPFGPRRRVTLSLSSHGVAVVPWREVAFPPWRRGDEDGGAEVREPRRPRPSDQGGAVALPLD
jgi:hypothetical protein